MHKSCQNDNVEIRYQGDLALRSERQIALTSKLKNHGLGQYGAEPHYSTLPFWQLCALKG